MADTINPTEQHRVGRVTVRFTLAELSQLAASARANDRTISDYVRHVALGGGLTGKVRPPSVVAPVPAVLDEVERKRALSNMTAVRGKRGARALNVPVQR